MALFGTSRMRRAASAKRASLKLAPSVGALLTLLMLHRPACLEEEKGH